MDHSILFSPSELDCERGMKKLEAEDGKSWGLFYYFWTREDNTKPYD
jgi:hypothetical protein